MYRRIPLDYNSLEPYIDNKTLDLHYNTHYKNYLNKLNELLAKNNYDYRYTPEELVSHIDIFNLRDRGEILYNLGGIINHKVYFYGMNPNPKNNEPIGKLKEKINKEYGNYDNFKEEFIKKNLELKGSGYTFLTLDSNDKLFILNTSNQDTPLSYGFRPILANDVWEHSYYLKYNANRKNYIDNWFKLLDYDKIEKLYESYIK